jgi:hypothetical protein
MVIAGLVIAIVAVVAAVVIPLGIEQLKRPQLEIVPSQWSPPEFVPWTFATVRIRNKPVAIWGVRRLLSREIAQACSVEIDYGEVDSAAPFLKLPGRWSSVREPLRFLLPGGDEITDPFSSTPVTGVGPPVSGGTAPTYTFEPPQIGTLSAAGAAVPPQGSGIARIPRRVRVIYDPTLDPGKLDISVSPDGEEVAVAILRDREAYAFTTASYNYPSWGNPEWKLELQKTYRIVVRVRGSGIQQERAFKLSYLDNDPSKFRLQEIPK